MNYIETTRNEIKQYFNPNNAIDNSKESIFSPNAKYRVDTISFLQEKPGCNWVATKVEIFQNENSIER